MGERCLFSVTVSPKNMVVRFSVALSNTKTTSNSDRELHYQTTSGSINSNPLLPALMSGKIVHRGSQEAAPSWILLPQKDAFTVHVMKQFYHSFQKKNKYLKFYQNIYYKFTEGKDYTFHPGGHAWTDAVQLLSSP